jgi:hypothetical protein
MMNERIKKLEILCRIAEYNEFGDVVEVGFDKEKFPELVVRECAFEAFKFWLAQVDCNDESAQAHIKEHFGVE